MATLEVLNPIGSCNLERVTPAPRLKDMNNKRIGLHWNMKSRGDAALTRIKELLEERFTGTEFKFLVPTASAFALKQEQLDEIAKWKPDAVIGTTGD